MQQLLSWTLKAIREEENCFSWMEEYRFDWVPIVKRAVEQIVDGKTLLIITDDRNKWFSNYILSNVNDPTKSRPLLPFYQLAKCFPNLENIKSAQDIELLEDMLDISYPNGYFMWYIGKGNHPYTKIAYRNTDNFLWIIDEKVENSFTLRGTDKNLDIKLIQLYKLFDATLEAVLFSELDFEK
jgi:hypothetical protein